MRRRSRPISQHLRAAICTRIQDQYIESEHCIGDGLFGCRLVTSTVSSLQAPSMVDSEPHPRAPSCSPNAPICHRCLNKSHQVPQPLHCLSQQDRLALIATLESTGRVPETLLDGERSPVLISPQLQVEVALHTLQAVLLVAYMVEDVGAADGQESDVWQPDELELEKPLANDVRGQLLGRHQSICEGLEVLAAVEDREGFVSDGAAGLEQAWLALMMLGRATYLEPIVAVGEKTAIRQGELPDLVAKPGGQA